MLWSRQIESKYRKNLSFISTAGNDSNLEGSLLKFFCLLNWIFSFAFTVGTRLPDVIITFCLLMFRGASGNQDSQEEESFLIYRSGVCQSQQSKTKNLKEGKMFSKSGKCSSWGPFTGYFWSLQEIFLSPWSCSLAHFNKFDYWLFLQWIMKEWMSQTSILKAEKNDCSQPDGSKEQSKQEQYEMLFQDLKTLTLEAV